MSRKSRVGIKLVIGGLTFVLCACVGLFWVYWPEVTACRYVQECGQPNTHLLEPPASGDCFIGFCDMLQRDPAAVKIEMDDRTLTEVIAGRQQVVVTGDRGRYRITVERGTVVTGPTPAPMYGGYEFVLDIL
jgi:hypothetical protein